MSPELLIKYTPEIEYKPGKSTRMTITYKVPYAIRAFAFGIRELYRTQDSLKQGAKTITIMEDMQLHHVAFIHFISVDQILFVKANADIRVTLDVEFFVPASVITPVVK